MDCSTLPLYGYFSHKNLFFEQFLQEIIQFLIQPLQKVLIQNDGVIIYQIKVAHHILIFINQHKGKRLENRKFLPHLLAFPECTFSKQARSFHRNSRLLNQSTPLPHNG